MFSVALAYSRVAKLGSDNVLYITGATMKMENINHNISAHGPGIKTYCAIWIILLIFTGLTVTTANMNLGKIAIIIVLAIAAFKSSLVLLYFMHVRYEKSLLIRLIIPGAIVLLAIFIGLTYSDVVKR